MASKDTSRRAVCRAEIDHAVVPPREATKPRDCGCPVCRRRVAADGEGFLLLLLLLLLVLLFLSLSLSLVHLLLVFRRGNRVIRAEISRQRVVVAISVKYG